MGKIFKTTMEIYTDYDPSQIKIDQLARNAIDGDAICENRKCDKINSDEASGGVRSFLGIEEEKSNQFGGDTGIDADYEN